MLDPLTAFGLAVNIIQLLDLGGQIIQTGFQAYHSSNEASTENLHLEKISGDLLHVTDALTSQLASDNVTTSAADESLEDLGRRCWNLGRRLLEILAQLKIESRRSFKGWQALQIAVKTVSKKTEIDAISGQLNTYRQQISMHLLAVMRNEQSTILTALRSLQDSTRVQATEVRHLRSMKKELIDTLSAHKFAHDRSQVWEEATSANIQSERILLNQIMDQMQAMSRKCSILSTEIQILDSLYFSQMRNRQYAIKMAYSDTFRWIFDMETTDFKSWLEHEAGIFWVRGKAGSGKSTLMKFLSEHPKTPEILQSWSGERKLVVASYYFWSAGTRMQRSQQGLMRSLLYQLLSACPELIPVATPRRWDADEDFHRRPEPWGRDELSEALANVLAATRLPVRFCFFIDGLDEYSNDNCDIVEENDIDRAETDHYELIRDLETLAKNPDVKLCLSSRPWNPFRKAFGNGRKKTLVLEDLTQADISKYIRGILEEDPRFEELAKTDSRAGELVAEIRQRAEGVFLWVFLAVRSLLRGLSEDDDISELKRRVQALPSNLKDFFRRILKSIDPEYQQLTCRLLALATYAAPLPLMAFRSVRLELGDPDYALTAPMESFSWSREQSKLKLAAITSVNKWCRDLLEVQDPYVKFSDDNYMDERNGASTRAPTIAFLHRTVKDFLSDSEVRRYLDERVGKVFDESLSMCRLQLFQTKLLTPIGGLHSSNWNEFIRLVEDIMHHAREYEAKYSAPVTAVIEELDRVGNEYRGPRWTDNIEDRRSGYVRANIKSIEQERSNCLAFAVRNRLCFFVSQALKRNPASIDKTGRPLIDYAVNPRNFYSRGPNASPGPSIGMIKLLLSAGCNVNAKVKIWNNASPWQLLLRDCYQGPEGKNITELREVVVTFINHGADLTCKCAVTGLGSHRGVISSSYRREEERPGETVPQKHATVAECLSKCFSARDGQLMLGDSWTDDVTWRQRSPEQSPSSPQLQWLRVDSRSPSPDSSPESPTAPTWPSLYSNMSSQAPRPRPRPLPRAEPVPMPLGFDEFIE